MPLEDVPYFESLGQSSSPHPCSCLVMYCDVFSQQIGGVMPVHNNAVGLQVSLWHGTCLCMACVSFTPLTIISPVYYHIRFLAIAKLFKWLLIHKAACILCHMHCFANYPAVSCHLLAPCQVKITFACFFLLINLHWHWRLINVGEKLSWWLEGTICYCELVCALLCVFTVCLLSRSDYTISSIRYLFNFLFFCRR